MSHQPISLTFYLLLIGSILGLSACCDPVEGSSKKDDTYVERVGEKKRNELNQSWINADLAITNRSFYIKEDSGKVISFKIDRNEVDKLLAIADQAENPDALRLRIFLTLDNHLDLPPKNLQPVFRPFLDLSTLSEKDTSFKSKISFEMDYLEMGIIAYLDSIINKFPTSPDKRISPKTAKEFITAWDTLDRNSINSVMYEARKPIKRERVKFYTYIKSDTREALEQLKRKKEDLLYLHLGVNKNPSDTIPFCTILQIDNPDNIKYPERIDLEDPPLFEFSVPCPKYCGQEDIFD